MPAALYLASSSTTRRQMLENVGLKFQTIPAKIDEQAIKQAMLAEGATPRDVADGLAEFKARKIADKYPEAMVIGCDQVLELKGKIFDKPETPKDAVAQLLQLSGEKHQLLSAAVVYDAGKPVWRQIGVVQMHMRPLSPDYIEEYVTRNWHSLQHSVGAYKLEEEGARLFTRVQGDYFSVLGLPLLDLLSYLTLRGILRS